MFIKTKPIQGKFPLLLMLLFLGFSMTAQNVGVNTSTPNSTLEVKGNGNTDATSALNVTNSEETSLLQINDNGRIGIGTITPGARFMVVGQSGEPTINVVAPAGNNPALRVNEDGRVGVGTATPGAKFMVVGEAGAPALNILNDGADPMNPALRVNDNGRVGVGTATPGAKLMVVGEDGAPTMNILNDGADPMNPALRVNDNGRIGVGTIAPGARFMVVGQSGEPTVNVVAPAGNNPALRVNEDGRVGVGTATPGAKFMVVGEDGAPTMNILNDGANPMNPALRVNDNGRVGVGTTAPGARFMVVGEAGAPALNVLSAAGTGMTPALRVNDNGRVGIGTGAPAFELDVVGDINASGNVRANGMVLSSDKRYKSHIQTLNNSLAILAKIRGTSYWWKDQNISEKLQIGFIAQELEEILPNLVHTDENGYKAVNYIGLIPVMTEAIKELESVNTKQNEKIQSLEARLEALEGLLNKND